MAYPIGMHSGGRRNFVGLCAEFLADPEGRSGNEIRHEWTPGLSDCFAAALLLYFSILSHNRNPVSAGNTTVNDYLSAVVS